MNKYTSIEEAYESEFGHLEHSDNYRAARVGDAEEMQRYVNLMRLGLSLIHISEPTRPY